MFSVPVLSAFQQYWSWAVLEYLQHSWNHKQPLTIKGRSHFALYCLLFIGTPFIYFTTDMSKSLGISSSNISSTLLKLGIIQTRIRSKLVKFITAEYGRSPLIHLTSQMPFINRASFNPNIRAIDSNGKELQKKEKSYFRINLKNILIENSSLLVG